jgi:pSer/pThr/pTyr-binding forkhead associated (FHA) protein
VLGRHPDRDIVLPSLSVSRRHARLRPESGRFTLDDLGSLNGTFVNGKPIDSVVLADGDEIAIGLIRLVFGTGEHVHAAGSVRPAA